MSYTETVTQQRWLCTRGKESVSKAIDYEKYGEIDGAISFYSQGVQYYDKSLRLPFAVSEWADAEVQELHAKALHNLRLARDRLLYLVKQHGYALPALPQFPPPAVEPIADPVRPPQPPQQQSQPAARHAAPSSASSRRSAPSAPVTGSSAVSYANGYRAPALAPAPAEKTFLGKLADRLLGVGPSSATQCRALKKDGVRCSYKAKEGGVCGVHAKQANSSPASAAPAPSAKRQSTPSNRQVAASRRPAQQPKKSAPSAARTPKSVPAGGFPELRDIDEKLQRRVLQAAVEDSPGVGWDDIMGLEKAKAALYELVIWPSLRPDLFTGLRSPPKGLLMFGPPGCGKTMLAKAVATQANSAFFSISACSLMSKWVGDSEAMVKALFAVARAVAPSVIFIDEIDSLLSARGGQEHEVSRRVKTEFLVAMDGVHSSHDDSKRILVIGATNRPQDLDDAALRRMPKRVYISLPDFETRKATLAHLMGKTKTNVSSRELDDLARRTEGYSGADLLSLSQQAAMAPIRELKDIYAADSNSLRPVTAQDFRAMLAEVKPSCDRSLLATYEEWNAQYGAF